MNKQWVGLGSQRERRSLRSIELPKDFVENFEEYLPPSINLTEYQKSLLTEMDLTGIVDDYLEFSWAKYLSGPNDANCDCLQAKVRENIIKLHKLGFKVPAVYRKLFSSKESIRRFRTGFGGAHLEAQDFLAPDKGKMLLLILQDEQMCGSWHLHLAPDGTGPVVFQGYPYGLDPEDYGPPPEVPEQFTQCSDSLTEFCCRAIREINAYTQERQKMLTSQAR